MSAPSTSTGWSHTSHTAIQMVTDFVGVRRDTPFDVAMRTNGQVRIFTVSSADDAIEQMMPFLSRPPAPPVVAVPEDPWKRMSPELQSALRELITTTAKDEWHKALSEFLASKTSEEKRHVWSVLSSPRYVDSHCDLIVAATQPPGASDPELHANEISNIYTFLEHLIEIHPQLAYRLPRMDLHLILCICSRSPMYCERLAILFLKYKPLRIWLPDDVNFIHIAALLIPDRHMRVKFIGRLLGHDCSLPIPPDLNTATDEHTENLIQFLSRCVREDHRRRILRTVLANWNDVQVHALATTLFSKDAQEEMSEMLSFHNHSRQEMIKRQQLVRDQEANASTVVDKTEHDSTSGRQCIVCCTNLACVVMGPCGHAHYCRGCWETAPTDARQRCPTCKTTITQVIYAVMDPSPPPRVPTPMLD